ncbi:Mis12-Mtw1 protein family-domain-containing protein [Trametes polyzona]|nr:Mis12-Mtw1 protein family-domain-containing protein [Trametes polyzona]
MIPTQPQPTKRKATDDANPLATATGKKAKRENSKAGPSNKRKLNGEEPPGGLVIVRAPAPGNRTLQIEPLPAESRAASRQPSVQPQASQSTKPPSKKLRADGSSRTVGKAKERDVYATTRADPEVDEDVRQMQSETDTLRRRSQAAERAAGSASGDVEFPARSSRPPTTPRRDIDTVVPLADQETPQIQRNKVMRGETGHRRRSSVNRGKRISSSFETTGVISHPHTSVFVSSFYKHIDYELPEPQRARQLLIWCSNRAMNELADPAPQSSSSRRKSTNSGKDPPPLSSGQADILKRTEETLIRMIAERKVDTNVYGGAGSQSGDGRPLRENEQNVKNRAREARFNAHIQQSKQEAEAWKELSDSYDSHRKSVHAEMEKRKRALAAWKAKGKERASAEDLDDWDVESRDLPQEVSASAIEVARGIVWGDTSERNPLRSRLQDLEYTMDRVHSFANAALQTTRVAEADLDRRFALLNISLTSRSQPAPPTSQSDPTALSSYIPPSHPRPAVVDPQDLLRTLSRIDAERPQTQVGDAARRALREVQRATDATAGMAERRLTGVPPPTPRKPPGTPRRAATPGKGR